jgi:hypothetical protein
MRDEFSLIKNPKRGVGVSRVDNQKHS